MRRFGSARRLGRLLIVLLFLYVAVDLASPMVPGAFAFNPDASVEGLHAERLRVQVPEAVAASTGVSQDPDESRLAAEARQRHTAPVPGPPAWMTSFPRAHLTLSSNPSPPGGDDH